jgi:hypothetical protein
MTKFSRGVREAFVALGSSPIRSVWAENFASSLGATVAFRLPHVGQPAPLESQKDLEFPRRKNPGWNAPASYVLTDFH